MKSKTKEKNLIRCVRLTLLLCFMFLFSLNFNLKSNLTNNNIHTHTHTYMCIFETTTAITTKINKINKHFFLLWYHVTRTIFLF